MIDIGILLDVCGIMYTEEQLIKLDKLLNDLVQKYINTYSNDSTSQKRSSNEPMIKQEDFIENDRIDQFEEVKLKIEPKVEELNEDEFQVETNDNVYQNEFETQSMSTNLN